MTESSYDSLLAANSPQYNHLNTQGIVHRSTGQMHTRMCKHLQDNLHIGQHHTIQFQ